jgi:DNA-binding MarR family transcriptional regulator
VRRGQTRASIHDRTPRSGFPSRWACRHGDRLDEEQFQGLSDFRLALRQFIAASETLSRAAGVTEPQYQAMLAIRTWPYETMSMKDLAEQLLLSHHGAVQLVDRLAKADLAERRPSSEDRRSVRLSLTDKGAAVLDDLAAMHLSEMLRQEPVLMSSMRRLKRIGP